MVSHLAGSAYGRRGYLVKEGSLDIPVLYLSHRIVRTMADYYRLLQTVREHDT